MSQKEHDLRIDYVEFFASHVGQAREFYESVFGWEFTDYGPDYTSFNDGRITGGFQNAAKSASGGPLVVMYATDLEAVEAKIREQGCKIVKEIFEFPGGRRFHFLDPAGNELAVWSDQ